MLLFFMTIWIGYFTAIWYNFYTYSFLYFSRFGMFGPREIWQPWLCPGSVTYVVVIASASRSDDRGFESRRGVRFLGIYTLQCCFS
jgi:hypothetical protein